MDIEQPDARVVAAVKICCGLVSARGNFEGIRWVETGAVSAKDYHHVVVKDQNAPPLWARFLRDRTNRPNLQWPDRVIRYKVSEIRRPSGETDIVGTQRAGKTSQPD